jgi:transketolase
MTSDAMTSDGTTSDPEIGELEQRGINVIRGLAMDAVQRANSGHPGTPMALAPLAHVLFTRIMRYDATQSDWPDRDRFVLSNGHASMLLYAMLYLTGFGLELEDIRQFRQWGSRTAGHPEYGHAAGIEVTTGPLGQGFANSVGIALAEANLRARFGPEVTDHHVFTFCSDGDLEEGISHEAASLAGHLGLGRLVSVYDDNHISIDGPTELSYTDDVEQRFAGYGWHVVQLGEAANDLEALEAGVRAAIAETSRPSLVILRSHIGWPSPKYTDTAKAHGNALGADEVAAVKAILGLPPEDFFVPDDVLAYYRAAGTRGRPDREAWEQRRAAFSATETSLAAEFDACVEQRGLPGWEAKLPTWTAGEQLATRQACTAVVNAVIDVVPGLLCGGADLTENTGMELEAATPIGTHQFGGRQIHWGVREHGMGSVMNGLAVSGTVPAGGTFFVFSDYMRPAVRLAALSGYKTAFVWTHDSVGLGEDGPTHQPVEQLASLRAMPHLRVIRPADANEVAQAWRVHIDGQGPTALVLTRQKVPVLAATAERAPEGVPRGAYTVVDETGDGLDLVLLGTGSEVALCVAARELLAGLAVRVVSMPSWDLFAAQPDDYQDRVLPTAVPTLAVEAAASFGWERYADDVVAIDRFGASAPGATVLAELGFTPANVAARARALLENGDA